MPSLLAPVDLAALVRGLHPDPFSVLGPHDIEADGKPSLLIRVFRPGVRAIAVLGQPGGAQRRGGKPSGLPEEPGPLPMQQVHHDGLFELVIDGVDREGFDYRLRITWDDGSSTEIDDPYRYGPVLTSFDLHLLGEGTHYRAFDRLGARPMTHGIRSGVHFAVWAPNAQRVSVVGDFNQWNGRVHPMRRLMPGGYWEIFLPDLGPGDRYKYEVLGADGRIVLKSDPCGRRFELPPLTASIVWSPPPFAWGDGEWMRQRVEAGQWIRRPMSVYEVHLGSWQRAPDGKTPAYRELAERLVPYVVEMGFTHIELLPVMEHPYGGSWGYQVIGFFAPTSRYGTPDDFKFFVDACHQAGIGVLLDWVPGHFPRDQHGLARFDGTALYEHADPRQGEQPDWGTLVFNYGRHEVRSFLISNALFWLAEFHIDGLRVDAVASMLYLDYSRQAGEWIPNRFGGRENLESVEFLKQLNVVVAAEQPGAIMVAEESTSWPGVSRSVHLGGLGFTYKWNMGWMHDMLDYTAQDPIHRKWHHGKITFSLMYAYSERFVLPFSHDEVVHGKRSMLDKMPGDLWQKHANLRALYGYMMAHPGKKLLFMGGEIGQWREWNHDWQIDWDVLSDPRHAGLQRWMRDLNHAYRDEPALWDADHDPQGFSWIDCNDHEQSVISLMRRTADAARQVVAVVNFTPVPRRGYRVGVPTGGRWIERLNSDADVYGGSGLGNQGQVVADDTPAHGHPHSLSLTVPPLGFLLLAPATD